MEKTASPSPPFTQAVGTTFHEKGPPGTPPLLHVVSPRHPPIGGRGGIAVVIWNSPKWSRIVLSQLCFLVSLADNVPWVPRPLLHPSPGLDGKEGVKACKCASVSLWDRAAASRSFLQHKRNEIQLAQLLRAA